MALARKGVGKLVEPAENGGDVSEQSSAQHAPVAQGRDHRQISGRLVIATHNPGKLHEMRDLIAPYGIEAVSAGELGLGEPEETGASFRANARIKADGRRRRRQACRPSPTIPVWWSTRSTARPAFIPRAGRDPARISRRRCATIEQMLRERGATTPQQRTAHFVSALCVAWPDGHVEDFEARVDGTLVWPPRGTEGFGYDPMFLPDGHTPHLRRDAERGEAWPAAARQRPVAPRARLRDAGGGLSRTLTTTEQRERRAFGVYIHWPFCLSKCPYCDFNSHVRHARSTRRDSCAPSPPRSPPPRRAPGRARSRASSSAAARHR